MNQTTSANQGVRLSSVLPGVVGQWSLTIEACGEMDAMNFLQISEERITGQLTGFVAVAIELPPSRELHNRQDMSDAHVNLTAQIKFAVGSYLFSGTVNERQTPLTMSGQINGCPGSEDGTWSATAQTGVPDPPR